jgi:hypothetical protein
LFFPLHMFTKSQCIIIHSRHNGFYPIVFYIFFNFFCNCMEGLTDVFILKCTCLEKLNPIIISDLLPLLIINTSIRDINLIPNQKSNDVSSCIVVDRFIPDWEVIQGFPIITSICQNNSTCTLVISLRYILKSVLSCGVPYLQFYFLSFYIDHLTHKVYS